MSSRAGALLLAWALGVYAAAGGLPQQPDHELHLLLAQHHVDQPSHLTSERFEGARVTGEVPLLHQLVALGARLPGANVERAYAGLLALLPLLLAWAVARLTTHLHSAPAGDFAAWLMAAQPLVGLFTFPFAQAPLALGVALAVLAADAWAAPLRPVGPRAVASAALMLAACCAHPLAGALAFALLMVAALQVSKSTGWLLLACAVSLAGAWLGLEPWLSLRPWTVAQTPHLARPAFAVAGGALAFSGVAALLAPGRLRALGFVTLCGLGLAFSATGGDEWLFVASPVAAATWGIVITAQKVHERWLAAVVVLLSLMTASQLGPAAEGSRNRALDEARLVLASDAARTFDYVTLGVGAGRFELARRFEAHSIDSPWAWMTPGLDSLPLETSAGLKQLDVALSRAAHLRWVISARPSANEVLDRHDFKLRGAWAGTLALYERVTATTREDARPAEVSWPWATLPLCALGIGAALSVRRRVRPLVRP